MNLELHDLTVISGNQPNGFDFNQSRSYVSFISPGSEFPQSRTSLNSFQSPSNNYKPNPTYVSPNSPASAGNVEVSGTLERRASDSSLSSCQTAVTTSTTRSLKTPSSRRGSKSTTSNNNTNNNFQHPPLPHANNNSINSKPMIKKRGRFETGDPEIVADDYSRSKRIVHEGFRALNLSDGTNNNNPFSSYTTEGSAQNRNRGSSLDSLFDIPPLPSFPSSLYAGSHLRKMSSIESEYSVQSEGNQSTRSNYNNNNHHRPPAASPYDSDESTIITSSSNRRKRTQQLSPAATRKSRVNSNHNSGNNSNEDQQKDELDREMYELLKNGKRQYHNPVDYYVDELIRKSRRKEMNHYLESLHSTSSSSSFPQAPPSTPFSFNTNTTIPFRSSGHYPSSSSHSNLNLGDYYIDEGFANAVIGPQPTTDHAISLIIPPTALLLPELEGKKKITGPERPPSSSSSSDDEMKRNQSNYTMDIFDPNNTTSESQKPKRKGDVTHSDWEIEEVTGPDPPSILPPSLSPSHNTSFKSIQSDEMEADYPLRTSSSKPTPREGSKAKRTSNKDRSPRYQSFLHRKILELSEERAASTDSLNSTSRDYGGSLGDMSDGNDSDMACCDDWTAANLSSQSEGEGYDDDEEEEEEDPEVAKANLSDRHRRLQEDHIPSSIPFRFAARYPRNSNPTHNNNDIVPIQQHRAGSPTPDQQLSHELHQETTTSSFPTSYSYPNSYRPTSANHYLASNEESIKSVTMDSDDGELMIPPSRHLENNSFPSQQDHMQFFETHQKPLPNPFLATTPTIPPKHLKKKRLPPKQPIVIDQSDLMNDKKEEEEDDEDGEEEVENLGVF